MADQKLLLNTITDSHNSNSLISCYLVDVPPSGDAGERALEGAPAAVVVGHSLTDDGDVHSPLRHSYSSCQNTILGGGAAVGPIKNGTAAAQSTKQQIATNFFAGANFEGGSFLALLPLSPRKKLAKYSTVLVRA